MGILALSLSKHENHVEGLEEEEEEEEEEEGFIDNEQVTGGQYATPCRIISPLLSRPAYASEYYTPTFLW